MIQPRDKNLMWVKSDLCWFCIVKFMLSKSVYGEHLWRKWMDGLVLSESRINWKNLRPFILKYLRIESWAFMKLPEGHGPCSGRIVASGRACWASLPAAEQKTQRIAASGGSRRSQDLPVRCPQEEAAETVPVRPSETGWKEPVTTLDASGKVQCR